MRTVSLRNSPSVFWIFSPEHAQLQFKCATWSHDCHVICLQFEHHHLLACRLCISHLFILEEKKFLFRLTELLSFKEGVFRSPTFASSHSQYHRLLEAMSSRTSPPPYQATTTRIENGTSIQARVQSPGHLPWYRKFSYGVGHVFNDLCASMWFTYLVLFYHKVVLLENTYAGLLILIGQVADAAATPIIGFLCDKTHVRYGRRKLWHLIGTIMVAISLFFFWHTCFPCKYDENGVPYPLWGVIWYFSVPIIIFQFGWASVQISHLSLIPELTDDKHERVGLNAIRWVKVGMQMNNYSNSARLSWVGPFG